MVVVNKMIGVLYFIFIILSEIAKKAVTAVHQFTLDTQHRGVLIFDWIGFENLQ